MNLFKGIAPVALLFFVFTSHAQQSDLDTVKKYLLEQEKATEQDVSELVQTDKYTSSHNGVTHLYGSQAVGGVRISNSNFSAVFGKDGSLIHANSNFVALKGLPVSSASPSNDEVSAIMSSISNDIPGVNITKQSDKYLLETANGYAHETTVKLVYVKTPESGLRLAWNFNIDMPKQDHWWDFYVDAENNQILEKIDWQVECSAIAHQHNNNCNHGTQQAEELLPPPSTVTDGSAYRVYELPVEGPNHGERTLAIEPASDIASPFGWHDDNGVDGAEYEYSRGNNVSAYDDIANENQAGEYADGGETLTFDFPYNPYDESYEYLNASITNLFYTNNRIHDILYVYGFDEASGNFQRTNYTGQGEDNDYLRAEAQDGEDFNNANMSTPPDGNRPRMQMYLWNSQDNNYSDMDINSPAELAGTYQVSPSASFGPEVPLDGLTNDLVLAEDAEGLSFDLCSEALNPEEIAGKIVVVKRGNCTYTDKVLLAIEAGAVACIVVNNVTGLSTMPGDLNEDVTIPTIMMSQAEGNAVIEALQNGENINVTLYPNSLNVIRDGSFDNGVVVHEYVHGLSNRLTGGPSMAGCLWNDEQMGEGWSDWYANMLTMDMTVSNPVFRPMGTYANGEQADGDGIRPAPYDTSFVINPYTYGDIGNTNITVPHGVGFVWATMLWDLTWAFVGEYGFEDLESGTVGGNNIVMQLVTDGLKLQPCSPGFIDGRDAILLADEINNDGQNQCLIWEVFARRGLGVSADQGSAQSRVDGEEAFDIPTTCQIAVVPPIADFIASPTVNCDGYVQFTDQSVDVPQSWFWDFGDGATSDEQNPIHSYAGLGTYTVSLTVTNTIGENTTVSIDYIEVVEPETPITEGDSGCEGEEVTLSASNNLGSFVWYDSEGNLVGDGDAINVTLGSSSETYTVYGNVDLGSSQFVGPETEAVGNGSNHNSTFIGTVDFEVLSPMILVSAYVYSDATGTRTVNLWDGLSGTGNLIDQIDVDIDFVGGGRVDLGFDIDAIGNYSIGLNEADLYRNDSGISYPYEGSPYLNIVGSSAGSEYYYYFYDLEVSAPSCLSEGADVVAEVNGSAVFSYESDGLSVTFAAESGATLTWEWDFGDGNTSDLENPIHTYADQGVYTVSLITNDGCVFESEVDVINLGIADFESAGIMFMPNPVSDFLYIQLPSNITDVATAKIFDMSGRLVKVHNLNQGTGIDIPMSDVANGLYLLVLENNFNAPAYIEKITVVH